jgi:hypothetical protein
MPANDTYYRFLKNPKYGWRNFLVTLSNSVISAFKPLTSEKRVTAFIVDDSLYSRSRSKHVEGLARIHDHTTKKFVSGFAMFTLGWSDACSFIPVNFSMLSAAKDVLNKTLMIINSQLNNWFQLQPSYIKASLDKFNCET